MEHIITFYFLTFFCIFPLLRGENEKTKHLILLSHRRKRGFHVYIPGLQSRFITSFSYQTCTNVLARHVCDLQLKAILAALLLMYGHVSPHVAKTLAALPTLTWTIHGQRLTSIILREFHNLWVTRDILYCVRSCLDFSWNFYYRVIQFISSKACLNSPLKLEVCGGMVNLKNP